MWRVLEKDGFPLVMVSQIRSLHEGMLAKLGINGQAFEGESSMFSWL